MTHAKLFLVQVQIAMKGETRMLGLWWLQLAESGKVIGGAGREPFKLFSLRYFVNCKLTGKFLCHVSCELLLILLFWVFWVLIQCLGWDSSVGERWSKDRNRRKVPPNTHLFVLGLYLWSQKCSAIYSLRQILGATQSPGNATAHAVTRWPSFSCYEH